MMGIFLLFRAFYVYTVWFSTFSRLRFPAGLFVEGGFPWICSPKRSSVHFVFIYGSDRLGCGLEVCRWRVLYIFFALATAWRRLHAFSHKIRACRWADRHLGSVLRNKSGDKDLGFLLGPRARKNSTCTQIPVCRPCALAAAVIKAEVRLTSLNDSTVHFASIRHTNSDCALLPSFRKTLDPRRRCQSDHPRVHPKGRLHGGRGSDGDGRSDCLERSYGGTRRYRVPQHDCAHRTGVSSRP